MVDSSVAPRMASAEATLVGQGVHDGYSVRLPNTGGQWASQFIKPYLDVQVVAPSSDQVLARMGQLITEIGDDLTTLQNQTGVASKYRIGTQLSPPVTPLYYQKGSRSRAGLAALLLGLGITFAARAIAGRDRSKADRSTQLSQARFAQARFAQARFVQARFAQARFVQAQHRG
ncbi:MAG: pentapeptide repeat-containing protein, partial [Jatrophihabitantaceae bacterium]